MPFIYIKTSFPLKCAFLSAATFPISKYFFYYTNKIELSKNKSFWLGLINDYGFYILLFILLLRTNGIEWTHETSVHKE